MRKTDRYAAIRINTDYAAFIRCGIEGVRLNCAQHKS